MKRIYSVLVENRSGVLCKVAGLFSRRCFNIESLAVGETDDHAVSCMTIVSSGDERTLEQIEKQLNKKLDVIKVKTLSQEQCYTRELMLLKVKYNKNNRRDIIEICDIMKTEIVLSAHPRHTARQIPWPGYMLCCNARRKRRPSVHRHNRCRPPYGTAYC